MSRKKTVVPEGMPARIHRKRPENAPPPEESEDGLGNKYWTTRAERRAWGIRILANAIHMGMDPGEAVQATCEHEKLRSDRGRGPQHATVLRWLHELTAGELDLTGPTVHGDGRLDIDEQRRKMLTRLDATIRSWQAQSKALAQRATVDDSLEVQTAIHMAQGRCEKIVAEYMRLKMQVLHLDKIPPLERLDDPDVRRVLRNHLERSLSYFTAEERGFWRELFTDQHQVDNAAAEELLDRVVQ